MTKGGDEMTVDDEVERLYGQAGLERLRAEQRDKLLPQLLDRVDKFTAKRIAFDEAVAEIEEAIEDIRAGRITDYLLRQPRKKAAEK